jgi:hypothetical protein
MLAQIAVACPRETARANGWYSLIVVLQLRAD